MGAPVRDLGPLISKNCWMTTAATSNQALLDFVEKGRQLFQPDSVHWCDGSQEEYDRFCELLVANGT
ncbi:MAG TPA: hypothetical protein VFW57_01665, partial [Acidimicrobiia bacterium]|nr:hypothetical protein [Acidimicrobiia bacterium]